MDTRQAGTQTVRPVKGVYLDTPCLARSAQTILTSVCLEQNDMEEVGKLVEERTSYRLKGQIDLEAEILNRRTEREKADDEEKLQEVIQSVVPSDRPFYRFETCRATCRCMPWTASALATLLYS